MMLFWSRFWRNLCIVDVANVGASVVAKIGDQLVIQYSEET